MTKTSKSIKDVTIRNIKERFCAVEVGKIPGNSRDSLVVRYSKPSDAANAAELDTAFS